MKRLTLRRDTLVVALTEVPSMRVTASLAIENVLCDAHDRVLEVYVVGASEKIQRSLQKLQLFDLIQPE